MNDPEMTTIPNSAEPVPQTGGDYLVTPGGDVWSTKWGGPRKMSQSKGRVCLWLNGRRWRPMVKTLVARTFGGLEQLVSDEELVRGLMADHGLSREEAEAIVFEE